MNPRSWLRSSAARLTFTYGVVVLLLVVALQSAVWLLTRNALENEVRRVMTAELDKLAQNYSAGLYELFEALQARADSWGRTGAVYLLADSSLTPQAGNLSAWPSDVAPVHDAEVRFRIAAAGELTSHPVRAHVVHLSNGYWLLVGTDTSEMERALHRFGLASMWGVAAITALILLMGRLFAAQTTRRVRDFTATCDAIVHSDLSRRLDLSGRGDEFDQLSNTVNDMLDRLEQQAVLLRTTYGSIAHDLRTPLYRLRVRMEEALRKAHLPSESQEIVQPALAELDRVQRTLATLLEIARAESGSPLADGEQVNLTQLVREMHELYQPAMQQHGLELTLVCEEETTLVGRRQLLAQLIANLLENALKHASSGTAVQLALRGDARTVTLAVSDNGPGMRPGTPSGGSGLGLNLVTAIAKLHRGEVVMRDNAPGLIVECRFERKARPA